MNNIQRYACVLCLLILTSKWGYAQNLQLGNLPIGSGAGQIGLVMALNEECHGPATITPTNDGNLAILDRVNGKIVIVGGGKLLDIPLPKDFLEPTDFVATTRGFLVVGAEGNVITVDQTGTVIAKTKTAYDPVSGSPRLVSLSTGRFALENLKNERIPIDIDPSQTGTLQMRELAAAGDYTFTRVNVVEVTLTSKTLSGPLASLSVKSNNSTNRIVNARPVWISENKGALVAVQESVRLPAESSFVRLLAFDANGKPTSEAYLGPETFACDTVRPYARLTDGRVVALAFHQINKLTLNVLSFQPVGTAKPKLIAQGPDAVLISQTNDELRKLELNNGTSDATQISLSSISRQTILERAREALEFKWQLVPSAYSQVDVVDLCNPPKNIWKRAPILNNRVGQTIIGIKYAWGGYLKELKNYSAQLSNNYLASNVCTCRNADCVYKKATGMDCSGFVSYAWRTGKYFTTASLPNSSVSVQVPWSELAPGDIVNKPSNHVRLVESVSSSPNGPIVTVVESTTLASCGGVCRRSYTQSGLQAGGYKPLRRLSLADSKVSK